jgi:hypothetical protein
MKTKPFVYCPNCDQEKYCMAVKADCVIQERHFTFPRKTVVLVGSRPRP